MVKITHPLRFFGFFGLFLVFIFLAYKSCKENPKDIEFVNGEQISGEQAKEEKNMNSKELSDFIEATKKEMAEDKKDKPNEKTAKVAAKKEEKANKLSDLKKVEVKKEIKKTVQKEPVKKEAPASVKIKAPTKPKSKKVSAPKEETIRVFAVNGEVSKSSKIQMQKTYIKNSPLKNIMIYGYYKRGESRAEGLQRAVKIKSSLLSTGVKNLPPIYVLAKENAQVGLIGELKYKR